MKEKVAISVRCFFYGAKRATGIPGYGGKVEHC
jgi:hypothetical protein